MPAKRPFYVSSGDAAAKQRILVAALELFVRNGLCETSIRDIAAAAGFTNPAMFRHFASKDALTRYLFERCYLELFAVVQRAEASAETFAGKHRAIIAAYLQAVDDEPNAVLYAQEQLRHFWPAMPPNVRRSSILGVVRRLLEHGRREGVVAADVDIVLLTTAWVGTLQQFARARYFGEFTQAGRSVVDELDRLLTRLVGAANGRTDAQDSRDSNGIRQGARRADAGAENRRRARR